MDTEQHIYSNDPSNEVIRHSKICDGGRIYLQLHNRFIVYSDFSELNQETENIVRQSLIITTPV